MPTAIEWDAERYAQHTAHHRAYDDQVLGPVPLAPDWRVLDVGSGVGDFSARVARLVPNGAVLGIDLSATLVERARADHRALSNLTFLTHPAERVGDLGSVALPNGDAIGPPFDLVVSTATLHWVPRAAHRTVYAGIRRVLQPGGRFRAEFGGAGQMADTAIVLDEESARLGGPSAPWYFPPAEEVASDLVSEGFTLDGGFCRLVPQLRAIPDLESLRGWLESQVLIAYRPGLSAPDYPTFSGRVLRRLEREGRRADGSYDQHYVRVDVLARAPADG